MSRIWTIARRELRSLFDHPTGYILLVVFLGINNFLFFRQAYLVGVASLRPMFDLLPWLLLFFVPAVSMRTLAEDTRTGTIEIVLAQPISELELLLGKFVGVVLFLWSALAITLAAPLGLSLGADLAGGIITAQYVGAALMVAGLAGVGVWSSSLSRNQITAFIIGVAVMFGLVLVGLDPLIVGLPPVLGTIAARLGVLSHFANIARGVIDLRDVVYFVSLAAIFLMLAYGTLMGRRLARAGAARKRLRFGVAALVASGIVVNLLGQYIGGRLDLTPGKSYTLSRATKALVANLEDFVTIKLVASKELPSEIALTKRDVDDLLRDLRSASRGNVRLVEIDPTDDEDARSEAQSLGIPPVQFNVVGQSQLQIQEGFMGLAMQYAEDTETIPFIRRSDDLEYRVASAIRSMTVEDKPVVALVTSPRDAQLQRTYSELRQQLSDVYEVRSLVLPQDSQPDEEIDALILTGEPDSLPAAQVERLEAYFARGGSALLMAGGMSVDMQRGMFAMPQPVSWNRVIAPYGVSIRSDMVYDLMANERVRLPTQFGMLLAAYPLWVRASSTGASVINEEIPGIFLPWTSSVDTAAAAAGTVTPLFVSSEGGGVSATQTLLDPQRDYPRDSLSPRLLAVAVTPAPAESNGDAGVKPRGRLIVVGNGEFATDRHTRGAPENLLFVLNAIDWLAEDEALIGIRSKDRRPPSLVMSDAKRDGVKYANLIGVPALVIVGALLRLVRRRRLVQQTYHRPGQTPTETA